MPWKWQYWLCSTPLQKWILVQCLTSELLFLNDSEYLCFSAARQLFCLHMPFAGFKSFQRLHQNFRSSSWVCWSTNELVLIITHLQVEVRWVTWQLFWKKNLIDLKKQKHTTPRSRRTLTVAISSPKLQIWRGNEKHYPQVEPTIKFFSIKKQLFSKSYLHSLNLGPLLG